MPKLKPGTVWPQPAKVNLTGKEIEEIAVGPMTYGQIEEKYGEEVAIDSWASRETQTQRSGPKKISLELCPLPRLCLR